MRLESPPIQIRKSPSNKSQWANKASSTRNFIGIAGYYLRFIQGFFRHIIPSIRLPLSCRSSYGWMGSKRSFSVWINPWLRSRFYHYSNFHHPFLMETDASTKAIGSVLFQKREDGRSHPIQFSSRTMNDTEKRYSACKREALSVFFALRTFWVYLLSSQTFKFLTDHQALAYTFKNNDVHVRLARWTDFLAEDGFEIMYRREAKNQAEDFLSCNSREQREYNEDDGAILLVFLVVTTISEVLTV